MPQSLCKGPSKTGLSSDKITATKANEFPYYRQNSTPYILREPTSFSASYFSIEQCHPFSENTRAAAASIKSAC